MVECAYFYFLNISLFEVYSYDSFEIVIYTYRRHQYGQDDWINDKNSESYQNFQRVLLFNISMAEREKQHLSKINRLMEDPYQALVVKCAGS